MEGKVGGRRIQEPIVPELTEFVLARFGDDEEVFSSFCSSRHNFQVYSGPNQHETEARVAKRFLGHALPKVREWAEREAHWSEKDAQHWRERDEEFFSE